VVLESRLFVSTLFMEPDRKHGKEKDRLVSLDITFCSLLNIEYIYAFNQNILQCHTGLGRDFENFVSRYKIAKVATRELISLSRKCKQCLIF